jgi:hypothetical protein
MREDGSVQVIPISEKYRKNWEQVFGVKANGDLTVELLHETAAEDVVDRRGDSPCLSCACGVVIHDEVTCGHLKNGKCDLPEHGDDR